MKTISITQIEYISWIISAAFFFLISLMMMMFTPALVFLKAWFYKLPIGAAQNMIGKVRFMLGTFKKGYIHVKGIGPVTTNEGDFMTESKSKASLFTFFEETGTTRPKEFPAIVQEIRERGGIINTLKQYNLFIQAISPDTKTKLGKNARTEYLNIVPDKAKAKVEALLDDLDKNGLKIGLYRSYKQHELQNMFPSNTNSIFIDSMILSEVDLERKKMLQNERMKEMIMHWTIGIFILILAFIIVWKTVLEGTIVQTLAATATNVAPIGNINV